MLGGLIGSIASALGGKLIDRLGGAFEAYMKKEITKEELAAKTAQALVTCTQEIEVSHSETLAKTYSSFMDTAKTSPMMQRAWAWVVFSQLFVLTWHQIGIPAYLHFVAAAGTRYPSSGSTVEWAYLLLGFCLGAGPVVLRNGPAKLSLDGLKALVKK